MSLERFAELSGMSAEEADEHAAESLRAQAQVHRIVVRGASLAVARLRTMVANRVSRVGREASVSVRAGRMLETSGCARVAREASLSSRCTTSARNTPRITTSSRSTASATGDTMSDINIQDRKHDLDTGQQQRDTADLSASKQGSQSEAGVRQNGKAQLTGLTDMADGSRRVDVPDMQGMTRLKPLESKTTVVAWSMAHAILGLVLGLVAGVCAGYGFAQLS